MAEIIILGNEKKCDYVTPDGMVKEGPEETAHRWSFLISLKRSSPWEEKESQKDSPGLKDKSEEIAASEQNTSKGKDRSLPCSNKKRKRKTCITKSAAQVCSLFEPKYKWMPRLILLGMLLSGANGKGVDVQREDFRGITIATSETEVATYSVPTPVDGANYLIYAKDGNKPGNFKCTPEFVEVHKSCTLEVGDKDKTECEGLQIFRNDTHTHLTVDGSKLTHDYTAFCILQHFPESHTLYPLAVGLFKEHDQALDRTNTRNRNLVISLSVVVAVLATLCVTFAILYCRQRSKGKPTVILTEMKTTIPYKDDPWMSNGSPA